MTATPDAPSPSALVDRRPLSATQRRIWASQRLHPDVPLANMADPIRIHGPVDAARFVRSFDTVVRRSDVLRAVVVDDRSVTVRAEPPATTEVIDLDIDLLDGWMRRRIETPLDATSCMYDSVLLRHGPEDWTWWLSVHHVAVDATAAELVLRATAAAYDHDGDPADADLAGVVDTDFFDRVVSAGLDADAPVETHTVEDPTPFQLGVTPGPASTESDRIPLPFGAADRAAIGAALDGPFRSISNDLSVLAVAAVAVAGLAHRLDGRGALVVGVPIHHRMRKTDRRLLGPLMEFAPLTVEIDPDEARVETYQRTVRSIIDLLKTARPGHGTDRTFDVVVNVLAAGAPSLDGRPTVRRWLRSQHDVPSQRLGVQVRVDGDGTTDWSIDVDRALAPADIRSRAADWLAAELRSLATDPAAPLRSTSLVGADEAEQLSRLVPAPEPVAPDETVHEQIRARLASAPDRVVAEHGDRTLTAREFDDLTDRIARWLVGRGVRRGESVGLSMPRGLDVLVAIQAVLRSGARFVLLDPADPPSRRDRLIADAGIDVLLDALPPQEELDALDSGSLPLVGLDDGAYVLFTSGSTGAPKGVPVSHRGLADYLRFATDAYVGSAPPVVVLHSSLRFDLTITSLFLSLLADGTVVVVDGEPVEALRAVAADDRITFLKATPSQLELYARFADGRTGVDTLVVGGEAFRRDVAERVRSVCAEGVRIFNEYGPTEAVVGCMLYEYDSDVDVEVDVPIGAAAPGTQLVVLDRVGQLAPIGVWGELFVHRPGQPTAYVAGAERDLGRFVRLPDVAHLDAAIGAQPADDWYRTGDRVRLVRPGVLVYGGRDDDQVKVNGIRLEPAEVEAVLSAHPAVATALVRHHSAADGLVAWLVPSDAVSDLPGPAELRAFATDRLPSHAVPVAFVPIADIPLAASAKVDVDRLPPPAAEHRATGAGERPATPTEHAVLAAWSDVLGLGGSPGALDDGAGLGVTDDVHDVGASSLALLEVVSVLEDEFGVTLSIAAAVESRTVRQLAEVVDEAVAAGDAARYPAESLREPDPDRPLPLSASEEALLFEYRMDPADIRYHGGRLFVVGERLELEHVATALRDVVAHHPPLHTSYGPERRPLGDRALDVVTLDPMSPDRFRSVVDEARSEPFDLDDGPLVRARLAHLDDGRTAIAIVKHHINGDAGTFDVLWTQLALRLRDEPLPVLSPSYAAHMTAQRRRHDDVDQGREFWSRQLAHRDDVATVAVASPVEPYADGYLTLPAASTGGAVAATGSTVFAHGVAALAATVAAFGGGERADFTVAASTRDVAAVRNVIGNYLNVLPMSVAVDTEATLSALVDRADRATAAMLEHRTVPQATIVRDARTRGHAEPSGSVLLVGDEYRPGSLGPASVEQEAVLSGRAVTDLTFFVRDRGDERPVELALEYRGATVSPQDAQRLLGAFAAVFDGTVTSPSETVCDALATFGASELVGEPLADHELVLRRWVEAATADPAAVAVRDGDGRQLRHGELLARADALAGDVVAALGESAVGRRVGVVAPRSCDLVVGMVAGQLAGAAVVPIDPTLPAARRELVARAADLDAVIAADAALAAELSVPVVVIPERAVAEVDEVGEVLNQVGDAADPDVLRRVRPDGDAYVVVTSGSTGTPRAVPVTHRNLAASTAARDQWFDAAPTRFLVTSSFGFDSSAVGLWWTLATGGTIVLPSDDDVHDVDALGALVERERVTHLLMVPSLYDALLLRASERLSALEVAIVAGEACTAATAQRHHELVAGVALVNEYGPTEATVWSTAHRIARDDDPVPIGAPIPGTTVRVADASGRPVPPGVVGELMVHGPGVTAGYADDPVATAERFVVVDGRRWYRTGDLVVLVDGSLRFVGRVDDQLNVGGVRFEPVEIEDALRSLPGIEDAVVVAAGSPPALVAHVVVDRSAGADGGAVDERTIRTALGDVLPPGAVPRRVLVRDELPRTPNGKLDRAAASTLPVRSGEAPIAATDAGASAQHAEPLASVLAAWRDVFPDEAVDADTDFFDLGGDSLSAVVLVTELGHRLDREVAVAAVLRGRTPAGMAVLLAGADPTAERTSPVQFVRFRGGNDGPDDPVVVMTASWDEVFGYQALGAAVPADTEVVALGLEPGWGGAAPVTTVDRYVDLALEELAGQELLDRPMLLVGWSIGGVVAMELAARLESTGADVRAVGLVDTFFPGEERHLWSNRWWKYKSLVNRRALPEWRTEVGKAVTRRTGRLRSAVETRLAAARPEPMSAQTASASPPVGSAAAESTSPPAPSAPVVEMIGGFPAEAFRHEPSPVAAPVVFFAASGTNPKRTYVHWRTVAEDLTVLDVQGRHRGFESVMGSDRVARLAEGLEPYLRR